MQGPGRIVGRPGSSWLLRNQAERLRVLFRLVLLSSDETLHVENHGHRTLRHNGSPVTECVARAGDTLMIEHVALLLVERRPRTLPRLNYHPAPTFAFGHPDATGMVGESPAAWDLREQLAVAALADTHVLLLGETGSGKELAARTLHALSKRANRPFVTRNAATLPDGVLDAELFGQARNYPNAGSPERAGLIEAADGGRLFLDEIGEFPDMHQAHLLRVLDPDGQFQRLGETRQRYVDLRAVAATNGDPERLKHDFLARFPVRVEVGALRERPSDVPLLMRALLAERRGAGNPLLARFYPDTHPARPFVDPEFVDALVRHPFPENARELQRLV